MTHINRTNRYQMLRSTHLHIQHYGGMGECRKPMPTGGTKIQMKLSSTNMSQKIEHSVPLDIPPSHLPVAFDKIVSRPHWVFHSGFTQQSMNSKRPHFLQTFIKKKRAKYTVAHLEYMSIKVFTTKTCDSNPLLITQLCMIFTCCKYPNSLHAYNTLTIVIESGIKFSSCIRNKLPYPHWHIHSEHTLQSKKSMILHPLQSSSQTTSVHPPYSHTQSAWMPVNSLQKHTT